MKKIIKNILLVVALVGLLGSAAMAADTNSVVKTNATVDVNTSVVATNVASKYDSWVFTVGGSGTTAVKGDSDTAVGGTFSFAKDYKLLIPWETGVRQTLGYAQGDNDFLGDTQLYQDVMLRYKRVAFLVGGNADVAYGNRALGWYVGPEAEFRVFVKRDVFMFVNGSYQFKVVNDSLQRGDNVVYKLGLGMTF